jgi:hypothetical protein
MFTALTDLMAIPPGGWRYRQEETNFEITGGDYYNLREKVRKHRQLNHLHCGPELDDQIQAQLCEKMGAEARAHYCRDKTVRPGEKRQIEFADVKHFLATIGRLRRFVPQGEANQRAEICASCPKNSPISGCTACANLIGLVFNVIGGRRTPLDNRLGACGVCGCSLTASVHIPLEAFPKEPKYEYPSWCWKA